MWLLCFFIVFGTSSIALAQNNGNGQGGSPDEGADQARNQRWVKEGTEILYAFPLDSKVGIGLSNPNYPFEVAGESRFHGQVGLDSNLLLQGDLQFSNGIWTSGGFLGIGTTDPQYNLDLVGTSRFDGNAQFLQSVQYDGETFFNENASFNSAVNFSGSGIWKANGQVGIGTTTPNYMLEVAGTSRFQQKALFGSEAEFSGIVAAKDQLQVDGSTSLSGDASLGSSLSVSGSSSFDGSAAFGNEVILPQGIWTTEGRLGIGTTAPGSMLEVTGTMAVLGVAEFGNNGSFAGNLNIGKELTAKGTSRFVSDANFDGVTTFNNDAEFNSATSFGRMVAFGGPVDLPGQSVWTTDGNVGIGTVSPTSQLEVAGTARFGGDSQFEGQVDFSSTTNFSNGASFANGIWDADGQLGIGTSDPQASLDVTGAAHFREAVNFNKGADLSGSLAVGQSLNVTGNTVIEGAGNIKGEATFGSAVAVSGPSTFSGSSEFTSNMTVLGATSFEDEVRFTNGVWSSDGRLVIGGTTAAEDYQLQVKGKMDTERLSLDGVPIKEAVALWDEQNSGDIVFTEGNVGIGTIAPDSVYKLSVSGKVRSKEVVVEADWADFVFNKDYELRSLSEVEQYIQTHGHLPEIPSEKKVQKEGIGVGSIQSKLLQKIEELTLYSIQQEKHIKRLEKLIKRQEKVLDELQQQIQEKNDNE